MNMLQRKSVFIRLIVFTIVTSFLTQDVLLASREISSQNNSLSANSPFDTDPRNNETRDEMAGMMRQKTEGQGGGRAQKPTLDEIKAWPSKRIEEAEKELVARFGYKGWNLILAHALSREIGGFTVPGFEIIETDEFWRLFYEANNNLIDEIVRINQVQEMFKRALVEVYKQYKTREERRKVLREIFDGRLSYLKQLFNVASLEEFENKFSEIYKISIDFSDIRGTVEYVFVSDHLNFLKADIKDKLDFNCLKPAIAKYWQFIQERQYEFFCRTSATDEDTKDNAKAGKYESKSYDWLDQDEGIDQLKHLILANISVITSDDVNIAFILQDELSGNTLEGGVIFSSLYGNPVIEFGYGWSRFDVLGIEENENPLNEATTGTNSIIVKYSGDEIEDVIYNAVEKDGKGLKHTLRTKEGIEYKITIPQEILERIMAIAKDVEKRLGYPIDIEFGVVGREIFIVQIRPITVKTSKLEPLPSFDEEDIAAKFPISINQGVAKDIIVVFADQSSESYLRDIQKEIGYDKKILVVIPSLIESAILCPFLYGEQLFWAGRYITKIGHEAINEREEGRDVIMGYFDDMQELKNRLGPMRELKIRGKTAFISEQTFDIYSNGDRAVLVRAGAVPIHKVHDKMVRDFLWTIKAKAQSCKDLDEELVLALDTDIGNLAIFAQGLFTVLNELQDALARDGLDNVRIFIGNGEEIETQLGKYLAEKGDKKDFVISAVVKNKNIAEDGLFKSIKDRMQITAVDDTNMENTDRNGLNYIPILSILELSIKKAMGAPVVDIKREYSPLPNIQEIFEQDGMLIIYLLPKSNPIPINELKERYQNEALLLTSA